MGDVFRDLDFDSRRTTERRKMTKTQEKYWSERNPSYWCGIDPGFTGGIAIIDDHQRIVECYDMPLHGVKGKEEIDDDKIIAIFKNYQLRHIAIEKAQSMPGNGCVSMFKYGDGYGQIKGICAALGLKRTLIPPQQWKKRMMAGMGKGKGKGKGKGASIVRAKELFSFIPKSKTDHGRAEAVLIAEYGRLLITGKEVK